MKKEYGFLVGGEWRKSSEKMEVRNPYNNQILTKVNLAQKKDIDEGISLSVEAFKVTKSFQGYEKADVLRDIVHSLVKRREEIARIITLESGKPIRDALGEVDRGISTFTIASEEANRIGGEYLPLNITPAAKMRVGITRRFPIGPIAAITPFNFPLNLVAHKVAPAIAAGNPIVLKPPSKAPVTSLILGEIILETEWPKDAFSVLPCSREVGESLVTDQRFKMLSFTGSRDVGWSMKERAGARKKVVLELGGNAGLIIHEDANIEYAAQRATVGSFSFSGQICISVQRLYIHEKVYEPFLKEFIKNVKKIKIGDPSKPETDIGPMVDDKAALRTQKWLEEGIKEGAKVLTGGKARGRFFEPTVISNASKGSKICSEEAFAPLVTVFPYKDIDEALNEVNNSYYGLQAGIFTNDHRVIWKAFEKLDVGGVIVNDIPTFRVDNMPYGGIKESGFGREGIKYAIDEMTEIKVMVLNFDVPG